MKKLTILLLTVVAIAGISCKSNEAGGLSEKAKKNLEANANIKKGYVAGDYSKMSDYIADDIVDHSGGKGEVIGRDSVIAMMKYYHDLMAVTKFEVVKELADDEYVFSWTKVTGGMGGKTTTISNLDVTRFKEGKAVEHWIFMDPNEMMQMFTPPQPSTSDSVAVK